MRRIQKKLKKVFQEAEGVDDVIWYNSGVTLYEKVCGVIENALRSILRGEKEDG